MRYATTVLGALVTAVLAGCGSGGSHPATSGTAAHTTADRRSEEATLCGDLKARLEGIEHTAAFDDPQPAVLKAHAASARVERASGEAIQATLEIARQLDHAQAASRHALRRAEWSYRRLARRLHGASAPAGSTGIQIESSFLAIAAKELRGCSPPG